MDHYDFNPVTGGMPFAEGKYPTRFGEPVQIHWTAESDGTLDCRVNSPHLIHLTLPDQTEIECGGETRFSLSSSMVEEYELADVEK